MIRHNRIWGNAMCGIHMKGDISQGGDGVISDAVVEDNVISSSSHATICGVSLPHAGGTLAAPTDGRPEPRTSW